MSVTEEMAALARKMEQAKAAGVEARCAILKEAEKMLRDFRREGSQRQVAEHRLRLALNSKDLSEIERSFQNVRAMDLSTISNGNTAKEDGANMGGVFGVLRGGERERSDQPPHSARLAEAATSMIRHLHDSTAKKQALENALRETVKNKGEPCRASAEGNGSGLVRTATIVRQPGIGRASPTASASVNSPGTSNNEWVKDFKDMLKEAKQCGVASTLIEHAKTAVKERIKHQEEQSRARTALERSLSKKDVTSQEVQRNLRRVQRLEKAR